jgi:hypothetical protein
LQDAPLNVGMPGAEAFAAGKLWNNDVNKLIKTTKIILFIFITALASHSRLP